MAFQNRCAQGLGSRGNNADVYVQLAITTPGQPVQIIKAGDPVNSVQARTAPSAFATENFNYDDADKHLAGLGSITELVFDLLNDPNASLTGTIQVTPIFWTGQRGASQNHSVQVAMANGQVWQKHIETTATVAPLVRAVAEAVVGEAVPAVATS
jgi:hypothetical protein